MFQTRRRRSTHLSLAFVVLAALAVVFSISHPFTGTAGRNSSALQAWLTGGWKDWNPDEWKRGAGDFYNPVIDKHWSPERMGAASDPATPVSDRTPDAGISDPDPRAVTAQHASAPYHSTAAVVGKVFFEAPDGPRVCSGTVVQDPAHPGLSDTVWTAGHCVHAGADGGWFRNIAFVPSYNNADLTGAARAGASLQSIAPLGIWWADAAATSTEWRTQGAETGGSGSPFDFAVLHVRPPAGVFASLQQVVGDAAPVRFDVHAAAAVTTASVWGYPAAPPFSGEEMFSCQDKPTRLSIRKDQPTMYRVGCTMTGGASGGGWFTPDATGSLALISNTSIGNGNHTWLAGPHLGAEAQHVLDSIDATPTASN